MNIAKDGITATLSLMLEDLYLYQDIEPGSDYCFSPEVLTRAAERHQALLLQWFRIQDLDGSWLPAMITAMRLPKMGKKGIHVADLMAYCVEYDFSFTVDTPPEYITILQQFGGEDGFMPASMRITLFREGERMGYGYVLPRGIPSSIHIDWSRPPLSPDAPMEEQVAWLKMETESNLGISSYGAAYSFLYITDGEVRHEVLLPLLSLESWAPLERADKAFITVEEQEAARDTVASLLAKHGTLEIDGIGVKPTLQRLDFYGLDFTDFARQGPKKRLSAITARAGAILSYSCKGAPGTVKLTWDMYNGFMPALYTTVYAYDRTLQKVFAEYDKDFTWENPGQPPRPPVTQVNVKARTGPLPTKTMVAGLGLLAFAALLIPARRGVPRALKWLLTAGLVASSVVCWSSSATMPMPWPVFEPPVSEEDGRAIFGALHANIYRAFDYQRESDIYDVLARSVSGDLLEDLYLQIHEGMRMQEQGGAVARVKAVRLLEGALDGRARPDAFSYRCRWEVEGTVEHWGHIHTRTNRYEARFGVAVVDGSWKITRLEVLDEARVRFTTEIRKASR